MPPVERIGVESYFGIKEFKRNTEVYDRLLKYLGRHTKDYAKTVEHSTMGADRGWRDYIRAAIQNMRRQGAATDDLKRKTRDFADSSNQSTQQATAGWKMFTDSVTGQAMRLRSTLYAARTLFTAFLKPFQQFIGIGMQAIGIQRARRGLLRMVGTMEEYNNVLTKMREATHGTIKDSDLISNAFKIMSLGLASTAEQAARVSRNVTLLAKAMGQVPTPEAAMQVFSLMMSNQSRMRLDAFGLSIAAVDTRIDHLKETMGVTPEEAFRIAVYDLMDERVTQLGLDVVDATTQVMQMNAAWANMSDDLKDMVAPEFIDFVNVITGTTEDVGALSDKIKAWYVGFVGAIRGIAYMFGEFVQGLVMGYLAIAAAMQGAWEDADDFAWAMDKSFRRVLTFAPFFEAMAREIADHNQDIADSGVQAADEQVTALDRVKQALAEYVELQKSVAEEVAAAHQQAAQVVGGAMSKAMYVVMDAAIAAQRRVEDVARQTAENVAAIEERLTAAMQQAQQAHQAAVENAGRQHAARMVQIEENYQRTKRAILQRYDENADKAIRNRDALALVNAKRQRNKELSQAREQRDAQVKQAGTQYQDQLAAAQRALDKQRQAAQESHEKALNDLERSIKKRMDEQRLADERRLEDQRRAAAREEGARKQALGKKLAGIYLANQQELADARQHYRDLLSELSSYYNSAVAYYRALRLLKLGGVPGDGGFPSYQRGGYAPHGKYELGERGREFVLSHQTTRMLEAQLGALTQHAIIAMASQQRELPAAPQPMTVNHVVGGQVQAQVNAVVEQSVAGFEGRITAAVTQALEGVFR